MSMAASLRQARRRLAWLAPRRLSSAANLMSAGFSFALRRRRASRLPPMVKVDISPVCSLRCTACLHAEPEGRDKPLLSRQRFSGAQKMELERFSALVKELRGQTTALSLYYFGDPLAHPRFTEFVRIASDAGLMTHASTHLSYRLSDAKIAAIVSSGLSHISVGVDGATQETYGVTRIGGRLDFILDNLERLVIERRRQNSLTPVIEVQHLTFPHHPVGEAARVEAMVRAIGVDAFTVFEGAHLTPSGELYNAVDTDPGAQASGAPRDAGALPLCHWPYSGTVVKYDGDVIPCCKWREGQQYAEDGEPRAVGNVFSQSLAEIWNGPAYQAIRREVARPAAGAEGSFCQGCPKLYRTASALGDWQPG